MYLTFYCLYINCTQDVAEEQHLLLMQPPDIRKDNFEI